MKSFLFCLERKIIYKSNFLAENYFPREIKLHSLILITEIVYNLM